MSEKLKSRSRILKEKLIESGYKGVEELIKVLEAKIIKKGEGDFSDEIAAEKMKNAAAAKKMAMFDAFDMLSRIQEQENMLKAEDGDDIEEVIVKKKGDIPFAESRAK